MFWKPWAPSMLGPPGAYRRDQVGATAMAKSSVMRLENSPEMSSCLNDGSSPVLPIEIVGSAISSLTPGSSMASVAGKNRLPTISCARAGTDAASDAASMASGHEFLDMENSRIAVTRYLAAMVERPVASGEDRRASGELGVGGCAD